MSEPVLRSLRVAPRVATPNPPLLVLLHGFGADEHDLVGLAGSLDGRFVVHSVQAPLALEQGGRAWFPLRFNPDGTRTVGVEHIEGSRRKLVAFLDQVVVAEGADPQRVYLAGFSQGGMMALEVALSEPDRVAGVVAMSARLLASPEAKRAPSAALAGLPALVVHGRQDAMVPFASGLQAKEALEQAGLSVTWQAFPMGHEISRASLALVSGWLTQRLDGPRRVTAEPRR